MAKDGLKVMDADMPIVEPADLWQRYIDPAFKDRAPRGLRRHPRDLGVQVGESIFPLPNRSYANAIAPLMTGQQAIYSDAEARQWDSGSQVAAMEKRGSIEPCCSRAAASSPWASMGWTRPWPPPSPAPLTTGWRSSAPVARTGCSVRA